MRIRPRCNAAAGSTWFLALVLLAAPGCLCYLHPIERPRAEYLEACQAVPACSRDHVYIFFFQGIDWVNYANLTGLRDYVQALGFRKTYYGQMYHTIHFEHELCRIRERDPDARFVLVGYSFGANMARDAALAAQRDGIAIDLLFYVGGNTLRNKPKDQPENAVQIVHILSSGWDWMGEPLERAENLNIPEVYHFGSPTHPQTCKSLAMHLAEVAAAVPVIDAPEAPIVPFEDAPTPPAPLRHITQKPAANAFTPSDWDFLQPVPHLKMPPPLPTPADSERR